MLPLLVTTLTSPMPWSGRQTCWMSAGILWLREPRGEVGGLFALGAIAWPGVFGSAIGIAHRSEAASCRTVNQTFEPSAENSTAHCARWSFGLCDIKGYLHLEGWIGGHLQFQLNRVPAIYIGSGAPAHVFGRSIRGILLGCRYIWWRRWDPTGVGTTWPHCPFVDPSKDDMQTYQQKVELLLQHGRRQGSLN